MNKKYNHIDLHKLQYHPIRIAKWYKGIDIYPILVEISPINNCNYRCQFCAFDYTKYKGGFLPKKLFIKLLDDMVKTGVKSIVLAGTGEPLLYKNLPEIIEVAFKAGLNIGLSTNGYYLTKEMAKTILPFLTWIRFSFNSGTQKNYQLIHGCKPTAFNRVVENIAACTTIKRQKNLQVTIGIQSLILKGNQQEHLQMATLSKNIGADYFSLKPFSPHPLSTNYNIDERQLSINEDSLNNMDKLCNTEFQIIVRSNAIKVLASEEKDYPVCLSLPFACYIEADGNIYTCNTFTGNKKASYGNLHNLSFRAIWNSDKKKEVMAQFTTMKQGKCRQACRMDSINSYLWDIKNPPEHKNFI